MPACRSLLVVSDNVALVRALMEIVEEQGLSRACSVTYCCSRNSVCADGDLLRPIEPIDVAAAVEEIIARHDLVLSAHCKQLFPATLVRRVLCINVHPGLNPHNRGWYPQVFSIINGRPLGATLHVIDEKLDHGPVIAREEVPLYAWDTSLTAYNRVLEAERRLLRAHLPDIIAGTFTAVPIESEGNLNFREDFRSLCRLDLDKTDTLRAHLNRLRALSHGDYPNAYFIDPATGQKIFVRVSLTPEANR